LSPREFSVNNERNHVVVNEALAGLRSVHEASQSPHSLKQITVFHYKRKAADRITEFLDTARRVSFEESQTVEFDLSAAYL
jgi:hypothetical protein